MTALPGHRTGRPLSYTPVRTDTPLRHNTDCPTRVGVLLQLAVLVALLWASREPQR